LLPAPATQKAIWRLVMKTVLFAVCLSLVSVEAHAISRYNSTSLSCGEARAIIRDEGAAIMRWTSPRNPGLPLFGRFVYHDGFCAESERAETTFIPTADRSCALYECKPFSPDDDFRFRHMQNRR
jgi:hypothetical protein